MISIFNKNSTKYDFAKKSKMKLYTRKNKSALHGQVVMIGDSIIDLYPLDKYYGDMPCKVYNRGISGDTSDMMLRRLFDNCLNIEPHEVIVLIGTNDIARGLTHDDTVCNITKILTSLKEHNVEKICLESVYPVNRNMDKVMVGIRTNDMILALNERLKQVARDQGVTYIDIYASLLDEDGELDKNLSLDGLHPNLKGYDIVTSIVKPYIE